MTDDPIPFRARNGAPDDATEVTLDDGPQTFGRPTTPLTTPTGGGGLTDLALMPLDLLPVETQRHLRAAGRETTLMATSLVGGVLKGLAVTLNAVAEVLNDYTDRHTRVTDIETARRRRQRVDIQVE